MKIRYKRLGMLFAVILIAAFTGCAAPGGQAARAASSSAAVSTADSAASDSSAPGSAVSDASAVSSAPAAAPPAPSSPVSRAASVSVSQSPSSAPPDTAAAAGTNTDTVPAAPALDNSNSVQFTVDATGDGGKVLYSGRVKVNAGETVYAVLKRLCDSQKDLQPLQTSGPAGNLYVSAIGGYGAKGMKGWKYSVDKHDGKGPVYPNASCSSPQSPPVQPGYTIAWVYASV